MAERAAAKIGTVCVRFRRDGNDYHRGERTAWANTHDTLRGLSPSPWFSPAPLLSVSLAPNTIELTKQATILDLPTDTGLLISDLSNLRPCGHVAVDVYELLYTSPTNRELGHRFTGFVSRAIGNYNGRRGFTRIECLWPWAYWDKHTSFQVDQVCPWRFADSNTCQFQIQNDMIATGTVRSIKNQGLEIENYSLGRQVHGRQFVRGYAKVDGMSLTIRDWDSANQAVVQLTDTPPNWWVGRPIQLYPGCDNTRETCKRWGNLKRWGGSGILMPDVNPTYESLDV